MLTSYAQNFEDVMLWRALSHVEHGFYIDIGAQDPLIDSVSLAFYEHGWRGIHVEPTPHYAELLRQQRPGDTVIQAAVGKGQAVIRFYEIPDTGISTADPVIAQQHRERGFDVREITVPCIPLSSVFKSCAGAEIHWLKIDIEGFEQQALSSWGRSVARPWIVVVESTLPLTQIETHEAWESILIGFGYTQVYFDGLNRYYISDAHPELKDAFRTPPNVFDSFALNGTASATFHHLIDARYKQKINEILAQNEQQKLATNNEIERLTLSLAALQETSNRAEREAAEREKSLSSLAQQTLEKSRNEAQVHLAELIERERVFSQQLQDGQQALYRLEQDRAHREKEHAEQTSQIRQKLEDLLRTQLQREQEVSAQLLVIQQQASKEQAEQARNHRDQTHALQRQHAEREQALTQQLNAHQQEVRRIVQDRVEREKALGKEIAVLQSEIQTLHHAEQLQAQQHSFEISTRQAEYKQLIQSYATLEAELKAQIQAEQQTSLQLRQALTEVRQSLKATHASLTWRMTRPLRILAALITSQKNLSAASPIIGELEPQHTIIPTVKELSPINNERIPIEAIMQPSALATNPNTPAVSTTLAELLARHDQAFVIDAYKTLLGRNPDPEGMQYYLGRVRAGISKIKILAQLRISAEGKAYAANFPALDVAIRQYKLSHLPILGVLYRQFGGTGALNAIERQLAALENQVAVIDERATQRFDQLEQNMATLQRLTNLHAQSLMDAIAAVSGTARNERTPAAIVEPPSRHEGINTLSPRSMDVFGKLKSAIDKNLMKQGTH